MNKICNLFSYELENELKWSWEMNLNAGTLYNAISVASSRSDAIGIKFVRYNNFYFYRLATTS